MPVDFTKIIEPLRHGLIVSCQAPPSSPLYEPSVIAAIATASINQGSVAIRIDTPAHVQAVKQRCNAPIIGLWKQVISGYDVYITPQFHHASAIATAGADIIAIDATTRVRPQGETINSLITQIHNELGKPVMADVDTIDNAIAALNAGADIIGTTLYGYTSQTQGLTPPGFELLSQIVKLNIPAICEGGVASPQMARQALDLGAYAVVVGTAITGIDLQVKAYREAITQGVAPRAIT
jgi:N-acylglucosamine-6-phosphate 2-epimerase